MNILKFLILTFIVQSSFALPGATDFETDYSLNSEFFSSEVVACQNRRVKTLPGGLEDFLTKMNCNNLIDPVKFCNCVSRVSINGLELSKEDELAAKKAFRLVAEDITLSNVKLDLKVIPEINEFLGSLKFEMERADSYFPMCFEDPQRFFAGIPDLIATNPNLENLTTLQRSKVEIYNFLKQESAVNSAKMIKPKSYEDDEPSGETFFESYNLLSSSDDVDPSVVASTPFMSLFYEPTDGRSLLKRERSNVNDSKNYSRDNITVDYKSMRNGDKRLLQVRESKIKAKCDDINEQLEKSFSNDFKSRVDVTEILISGVSTDAKMNEITNTRIEALSDDGKLAQGGMEIFNIDKLYCKNIKRNLGGRSQKETDLVESTNEGKKYQEKYIEIRNIEEQVYNVKSDLVKEKGRIETASKDLNREQNFLDIIDYMERLDDPKEMDLNDPRVLKLGLQDEYGLSDYIDILNNKSVYVEGFKEISAKLTQHRSKVETLSSSLEDFQSKLTDNYQKIKIIDDELIAKVGIEKAEEIKKIIKTKVAIQFHKQRIEEDASSLKQRLYTSEIFDKEFEKRTFSGRAIRKSRSHNATKTFGSNVESNVNTGNVPEQSELARAQRIEERSVQSQSDTNYFSRNSSPSFSNIDENKKVIEKKPIKNSREDELQKQIAALKAIIDSKSKPKASTQDKDSEINDLKNDLELQKIKNEKVAIENQLKKLKEKASSKVVSTAKNVPSVNSTPVASTIEPTSRTNFSSDNISSGSSVSSNSPAAYAASSQNSAPSSSQQNSVAGPVSRSSGQGSSAQSSSEKFTLSSGSISEVSDDSRVVKLDFNLDSISEEKRNAFFESLFLKDEHLIVLELPDGEKIVVENNSAPTLKTKDVGRNIASKKDLVPKRKSRSTVKYEDLKLLIDSNLDVK